MHEYYHVPDKSESWAVIASQVQGVPTSRLRKDFGSMANAVKRMEVNQVAQDDKVKCFSVINLKLKEAAEREIDKSRNASQSIPSLHEGASEPPGEMLGMPETQTALV